MFSRCDLTLGFLAFCDIDRVDADGSHRRTLVGGRWIHERPRYSPDGRTLAFSSNKDGFRRRCGRPGPTAAACGA